MAGQQRIPVTESPDAVRALVQFFHVVHVTRQSQLEKEVRAIADIFNLTLIRPDHDWRRLIAKANRTFEFVQMSIRAMVSEINGHVYWGLVNTAPDAVTAVFADKDLYLFQSVLQGLIERNGSLRVDQALDLRCRDGQHRLTQDEARAILRRLCRRRWLKLDNDDHYLIGERAYLQYGSYFDQMQEQEQLPTCPSCRRWVILGTDNGLHFHCNDKIHDHPMNR